MSTYPRRVTILCVAVGLVGPRRLASRSRSWRGSPTSSRSAVLSALALYAGNRAVDFPDGTKFSAGFMIEAAAVVDLRREGLAARSADRRHVLRPLVRQRPRPRLAAGRVQRRELRPRDPRGRVRVLAAPDSWMNSPPLLIAAAILLTAVFFVVNDGLVAIVLSMMTGEPLSSTAREMASSTLQSLPFAILGVFLGRLYLDVGAVDRPALRRADLRRPGDLRVLRRARSARTTTRCASSSARSRPRTSTPPGHAERVAMFAELHRPRARALAEAPRASPARRAHARRRQARRARTTSSTSRAGSPRPSSRRSGCTSRSRSRSSPASTSSLRSHRARSASSRASRQWPTRRASRSSRTSSRSPTRSTR